MVNEKEQVQEIMKSKSLEIMKALLKEYAKAPQSGEFRELFGSTVWLTVRQRPEIFEQRIKLCNA
jgi:nucleoside-triphosphatase THEP1